MYIRTKDGVYVLSEAYWAGNKDEILNQSENLDELCDEFVFVNKVGNFDKSYVIRYIMPNHIFTEPTVKEKIAYIKKYYKDELDKIRGAIYTDEGLIYRSKFNESGDLELI